MKFTTAASVLAVLAISGVTSVAARPLYTDYDLDVRGEAVDSKSVSARNYDEDLKLANRDYDGEFDIATRDFMEAVEDVIYQRASQAAKMAWEGLGKDALAKKVINAAQQGIDNNKPKPAPSANWQKALAHAKSEAAKKTAPAPPLPKFPKLEPIKLPAGAQPPRAPTPPPQQGGSKILAALEAQRNQNQA